jgi:hypothetical protein
MKLPCAGRWPASYCLCGLAVDAAMEAFEMAQRPEALKVMLENTDW